MKYTYDINGRIVTLSCGEEWKHTADFFAAVLKGEEDAGSVLQDGSIIQIGWSFYKLVKGEDAFRVVTFDYRGDPFADTQEDLSLSLRIFHEQTEILNRAGVKAETVSFQDTMLIKRTAMTASKVYLQRLEPAVEGDSGWYMGVIHTYRLLSFCEAALALMPLPLGTIALFEDGKLLEVVDENNKPLL